MISWDLGIFYYVGLEERVVRGSIHDVQIQHDTTQMWMKYYRLWMRQYKTEIK